MIWRIPGIWRIVEGSIDEPNSKITIGVGEITDTLHFPGTTDEAGLRILAQIQCDERTDPTLS